MSYKLQFLNYQGGGGEAVGRKIKKKKNSQVICMEQREMGYVIAVWC